MNSGTISDSGRMKGSPLQFYLAGKDIATVRFSCKNHQINFMDWTEKREDYGNAQNFTVAYGEDESEYYYLTINWVPNATIRELTDSYYSQSNYSIKSKCYSKPQAQCLSKVWGLLRLD